MSGGAERPEGAARVALVSGISGGIGAAIAETLAADGFALTVVGRRTEPLEARVQELRGQGYEVEPALADLRHEDEVKRVIEAHRDRYGRLDVLVNNAGVAFGHWLEEISLKQIELTVDVNLKSMMLMYREALELLAAAGAEHRNALVINTASITGKAGEAWLGPYSASKHGIVGFTEAMNRELNGRGIKSCALCPAFVATAMSDFLNETFPPERMIQPADIAEAVRFVTRLSPGCVVPEIVFDLPGNDLPHPGRTELREGG